LSTPSRVCVLRKTTTLEVCVDSVASAVRAVAGGARAVELCCALVEGGLTPSAGLVRAVRAGVDVRLRVLVRPRPGDFVYDAQELAVMLEDVRVAREAGADGVVVGVLTPEGDVDVDAMRALRAGAGDGVELTFHRALDVARDYFAAFDALLDLGFVDRVLTSGREQTAERGAARVRALVDRARARKSDVVVAVGGGISEANAARVARESGANEVHGSLRASRPSRSSFALNPPIYMGGEKINRPEVEYSVQEASTERVRAVVVALGGR
jgi:copper homeostasis protein